MFSISNAKIMVTLLSGQGASAASGGNDDLSHYLMHQADEREAAQKRRWWPVRIIAMMRARAMGRRGRDHAVGVRDSAADLLDDFGIVSRGHSDQAGGQVVERGAAMPAATMQTAEIRQPVVPVPVRMSGPTMA